MQTAAIVLLSVFGGILFVLLVAGMAALIVLHLRAAKAHRELLNRMDVFARETTENFATFSTSLTGVLTQQRNDVASIIEGARSSFSGIRAEIKTSQETQAKALDKSLKTFETTFRETIGKINGDMLLKSSMQALQATREISALCITLKSLLVDHQAPAATSELGPEEYGPSDTIYSQVSPAARMDAALEQQEAADAAPLFSTPEV